MATTKGVLSKHSNRNINAYVHQKGNLLNTQQRLLDQTLEDPKKNYTDKVNTVVESWQRLGALVMSTHVEDTRKYLINLHRCTVLVVLNTSWCNIKPLVKTHFKVTLERCANALKDEESESRCRAILHLVEEPWGKSIGNIYNGTYSESEAERYLASDRLILRLRLQGLVDSNALKIALGLVGFIWRWRRSRPDSFIRYSKQELDYMEDLYLILLYKLNLKEEVVFKLKELELEECYEVIKRLISLSDDLSSGEKRLCRYAPKIAKLGCQVLLAKAMLGTYTPQLADYVQIWLDLHKELINEPKQLEEMIRKIHSHAKSIRHSVTFCKVLQSVLGDSQRLVCIELYIRSLTNEMNLMESHRSSRELSEAHETELRLSEGFIELSNLLESNLKVRRECVLTAFSLNPTASTLERLGTMAELPDNLDTGQPSTGNSLDANSLGLTESLCSDLMVVLFCIRYKDLNWSVGWTKLEEECKRYLTKVETGARNADVELKYLNLDYDLFKDWPEEEDADNGIEKGYEPTTDSEDDGEEESDETCGSDSSNFSDHRRRRLKKPKPVSESSDDTASDVVAKAGVGRPKRYKPRRGRPKYLDSNPKMSFPFQRKESKKMTRPLGRPPLNRTKPGMRHSGRGSQLISCPVGLPLSKPGGKPTGRPLGRPPGRPGPKPALRAEARIIGGSVGRTAVRPSEISVSRPIGRPPGRPSIRPLGRPSLQSVRMDKEYDDLDEEVRTLLSPTKSPNSASVVKSLRNFRTPKKKQFDMSRNDSDDSPREDGVGRFAPLLSTLNLNPKIVLNPRDPLVEQYMSGSKQTGVLKKVLANRVPGLDSLDMIVPCPQEATVQVVQIGQIPAPGQSSGGVTVKTESEDERPDHVNGSRQAGSNSGDPPTEPGTPITPSPTTPTMHPSSNLVTENHSGLLRLRQDSASSMQVSSTQGNATERRDLLQIEANVRGSIVSSSQNWPGAPPKPETPAIKKTDKRHRKQMSTQTASLPQFHQAFGKQGYPGQQGASGESRSATAPSPAAAAATGTATATVASTSAAATSGATTSSGAARSGNALKQALAGGNSARLIKVPGEPSLLLQAISSDNVVQEEVKLPIRSGAQPSEKRPSMLMKQLTAPVVAHTVKPPGNLLLTSTASAVIVNSNAIASGSPVTFGATTSASENLATKSVNTQTTASARDAVITSAPSSPVVVTTPSSRPLGTQNLFLVSRRKIAGQTSTGTLTTNLSASTVSSSQNSTSASLTSDEDRTHRTPMSVAFNRRVRRAPVSLQSAGIKYTVKPTERFPAPLLSLLNQSRPTAEPPLTGGTATASQSTTSSGSRPLRQPTPPALVTSTTLEQQLREFESVLEQVTTTSQLKETLGRRLNPEDPSPSTPPVTAASFSGEFNNSAVEKTPPSQLELQDASPSPSGTASAVVATNSAAVATSPNVTPSPSPVVTSAVSVTFSTQPNVVQSLHKLTPIVVSTSFTQTVAVASPASVTSQSSSSPSTTPSSSVPGTPSKSSKSKPKSVKTSAVQASVKTSPIAKSQKTQEDEQTTARILSILRQYDEQLRCSPDLNNKPAPRRRNNHQTHPSPNSKRKKSGSKSKTSSASDMSPSTDDTHTLGSEDSSGMASQPSGELGDPCLTEDEAPPRASIFSATPSPVITAAVPSTTPSPTPQTTSTTMCIGTPTLVAAANSASQQTSPKMATSETKTEVESKSYPNMMPVYMVPVSSASSLPVVVSTGTQMLHVHPVGPNGAPLVGVGLGGNVQVPVVVRQIPAKQLSTVTTLEGAQTATRTANVSSGEIANAANTESRPETILLNVATPTRAGSNSQPVMAIVPTFHQILTTVSSTNTSTGTTAHIRLPAVTTSTATTVATSSSDAPLTAESEATPNARPATLLGLQLLQQQRSAKQRSQPKQADQPSQLQQLLSQDQPTPSLQSAAKQGHVFRCVMKSVKTEQEPPILLQIAKMRDDSQDAATNQLSVQVNSPQHRVLKPPQPATIMAAATPEPVAQPESPQVVLMRQTPQPAQQAEQVQPQVLQLVQTTQSALTSQPTQVQTIETEQPKLQVQTAPLNTVAPKARPVGQLIGQSIGQPAVTQVVQQATQIRPTIQAQQAGTAQQQLFTVQFAQRHQQVINVRNSQKLQEEQHLQLAQQSLQTHQQSRQLHLQLQQKQHLLQQKRQQVLAQAQTQTQSQPLPQPQTLPQTQPQPQAQPQIQAQVQPQTQPQLQAQSQPRLPTQLPPPVSPEQQVEIKCETKQEPESPPASASDAEKLKKEEMDPETSQQSPSSPHQSPHRSSPSPGRTSSAPEGENTNESGEDSPASSNTIHMPSEGIDGDTSPDRSPGGPISCWRYTESRPDREQIKVSGKLSSRCSSQPLEQAAASKTANKRKPPLNMYPCSLSKSLSEECEDLGVDRPSTRELFPDTDLFLDSNLSPSYAHTDSPSNSQDGLSTSPEPPDKKKKYPVLRSFPSQKSDFVCETTKEERKQNGEVAIDAITAGVALASEVTAASPLPVLASSITSSRDDASSPDASMVFMHQGRVTTYGRRRDARPVRDEWESEPLRAVATSDLDDDFWQEPLVDDKDESLPDLEGHCPLPASNGTDPLAARVSNIAASVAAVAAVAAAVVAKPVTTTSMTTRRGALKRKDANDAVDTSKRDTEKKTEKKLKRSVPSRPAGLVDAEEEEVADEKRGSILRSKRTVMNRTEVFPRDAKKRSSEEGPWRETSTTAAAPTTTVRRTSLRARVPGQPGSPAASTPGATVETAAAVNTATLTNKSVTKLDRNSKKGKASKSIKGVAHKKK